MLVGQPLHLSPGHHKSTWHLNDSKGNRVVYNECNVMDEDWFVSRSHFAGL